MSTAGNIVNLWVARLTVLRCLQRSGEDRKWSSAHTAAAEVVGLLAGRPGSRSFDPASPQVSVDRVVGVRLVGEYSSGLAAGTNRSAATDPNTG
jgi:hypothetical protein